jgi:hypothetical protein
MATRTPDHITIITETKKVNQDDFEIIGKCNFISSIYPLNYNAKIVGIIMKKNGGTGTLIVKDMVADKELARYVFSESDEHPMFMELEDNPVGNDRDVAYITIQAKNDGQGFVEVEWMAFEVS